MTPYCILFIRHFEKTQNYKGKDEIRIGFNTKIQQMGFLDGKETSLYSDYEIGDSKLYMCLNS